MTAKPQTVPPTDSADRAEVMEALAALNPAGVARFIAVKDEAAYVVRELLAILVATSAAFESTSSDPGLVAKLREFASIVGTPRAVAVDRAMNRLRVYGITEGEVLAAIGPSPDDLLIEVAAFHHVEALLQKYREAQPIAKALAELDNEHQEVAAIDEAVERLETRRSSLLHLAKEMKLAKGKKWNIPPSEFWTMPMEGVRRRPWVYGKIEKWELVGDRIVRLYDLIASHVPAQRRQRREKTPRAVFNQTALRLTADTVGDVWVSAFGLSPLSRPLKPSDVKARLLKRRR